MAGSSSSESARDGFVVLPGLDGDAAALAETALGAQNADHHARRMPERMTSGGSVVAGNAIGVAPNVDEASVPRSSSSSA